jgi:hypothetical protein
VSHRDVNVETRERIAAIEQELAGGLSLPVAAIASPRERRYIC